MYIHEKVKHSKVLQFGICSCAVYFQTTLISVDGLHKMIHPSQLTGEFDGTMSYDNKDWIEIRLVSIRTVMCILYSGS